MYMIYIHTHLNTYTVYKYIGRSSWQQKKSETKSVREDRNYVSLKYIFILHSRVYL